MMTRLTDNSCGIASFAAISLFATAGLFFLTGCQKTPAAAGRGGAVQGPAPVRVATLEQSSITPKVTAIGTAVPEKTSIVASGANGIINTYEAEEGKYVAEGTVLSVLRMVTTNLEIDEAEALLRERVQARQELEKGSRPDEIREAEARKMAAQALRESTSARLKRIEMLVEQKASSQDDLDDAREKALGANQMFLAADARFQLVKDGPRQEEILQAIAREEAQKAHVDYLKAEKEKRTTRAPFAGFVVHEHAYLGQWLSKGDPVVTLAKLDQVEVTVNVDEKRIGLVRLGQDAEVVFEAMPGEVWTGRTEYLVPRSNWESGSRGFPVKVSLKNRFVEGADGDPIPLLKEGLTARVTFSGVDVENALIVPKDAIVRSSRGTSIIVVDERPPTVGDLDWFAARNGDLAAEIAKLREGKPEKPLDVAKLRKLAVDAPPFGALLTLGKARAIPVQEGIDEGKNVQVFSDDLKAGMKVVVEGSERLRPFQDIVILPPVAQPTAAKAMASNITNAK